YGFIPRTWSKEDKDPLDIMVICSTPTFPGCLIKAKPIGALELEDTGEKDTKIIAVASDDPNSNHIKTLKDIHHLKKEIKGFWESYAELEPKKEIKILGWRGKEAAQKTIQQAIKAFEKKFSPQ
ncbi:MAG TPA: inorganic diphosphatase, partial [bacterium (Candidatus Stahlbacteria)]|nr:inorganic diphosphatase [Candidatus Stahlbacteria bacterium]